jgi:ABC-type xylose transport system substrate-binding protein
MPPDRHALILVKVLGYDDNLKARAGAEVVVGVLYKIGNAGSQHVAEGMQAAFQALPGAKAQGLPIKAILVAYDTAAGLVSSIKTEGLDVLFISAGLDAQLAAILELSRIHQVMSIAGTEEFFAKGASIGISVVQEKPAISINLTTSKGEGVAFGAGLLRLAKVVK